MSEPLKTVTKFLECELTDEETQQAGSEMAGYHVELRKLQAEHKKIKANQRVEESKLETKIDALSKVIHEGKERRDVEVAYYPDYTEGTMEVIRTDTGEIIEHRPLLDEERQESLVE